MVLVALDTPPCCIIYLSRHLCASWVTNVLYKQKLVKMFKSYIYLEPKLTSVFEGQPPKRRPFPIKTRVIWVPGISYFNLMERFINGASAFFLSEFLQGESQSKSLISRKPSIRCSAYGNCKRKEGRNYPAGSSYHMGVNPKIMGKPPNHPLNNRVVHYKPSILVVFPQFLG